MYEIAQVVSIKDKNHISVTCSSSACQSCSAGALCSTKGKTFIAKDTSDSDLHIGDTVELFLPPAKTILAGFITLMVPILLFPVGYYIGKALFAQSQEIVHIGIGILGIALGFLISRIFSRTQGAQYKPTITRIIT